jgi:hypothetical protein
VPTASRCVNVTRPQPVRHSLLGESGGWSGNCAEPAWRADTDRRGSGCAEGGAGDTADMTTGHRPGRGAAWWRRQVRVSENQEQAVRSANDVTHRQH